MAKLSVVAPSLSPKALANLRRIFPSRLEGEPNSPSIEDDRPELSSHPSTLSTTIHSITSTPCQAQITGPQAQALRLASTKSAGRPRTKVQSDSVVKRSKPIDPPKTISESDDKVKRIFKVLPTDIRIPDEITNDFERWRNDSTTFLDEKSLEAGSSNLEVSDLPTFYTSLATVERRQKSDVIRWRFLTLLFYDLACLLGIEQLTAGNIDHLLTFISGSESVKDPQETIKRKIKKWVAAGLRYHHLSMSLGGPGCLFVLPDLSNNLYINTLL